jgi:hypothetical protein
VVPFDHSRSDAEKSAHHRETKLPARLTRLTRRLAVIFVREAIPPAAAFSATSAVSSAPIPATATGTPATTAPRPSKSTGARPARRSTLPLRTRFVHFQIASAGLFTIQARNRLRRFFIIRHFHKREPARAPRFAVHRHVYACNLPERLEQRPEVALRRLEIHVANKKAFHVASPGILMRRWRESTRQSAALVVEQAASNRLKSSGGGSQCGRREIQAIQCRKRDNITFRHETLNRFESVKKRQRALSL